MNNIFNLKRFGFVFRKDFLENRKLYLLLFLTMLGIMAIVSIIMTRNYCHQWTNASYNNILYHNKDLLTFFSLAFLAGGLLFASTFMTQMNSKLKSLSFLSSPSSNFEKYLSRWIIVTIGYVLAFFIAMWVADFLRVTVNRIYYPDLEIKFLDLSKLYYPTNDYTSRYYMVPKFVFILFIFIYLFFQSLFLLGTTFWEKASFVKTFVAVAVIIFAYIMICRWTILFSYEEGLDGFGNVLGSFFAFTDNGNAENYLKITTYIALSVLTLTNWTLAFFRLRESEIIKRL